MTIWRTLALLSLLSWQSVGFAAPLSLDEIVQMTLARNVKIENAAIARILERFDVDVAENAFAPKYTFTGNAVYSDNQDPTGNRTRATSAAAAPGVRLITSLGTQFQFFWENDLLNSQYNGATSKHFTSSPYFAITQPLLKGFGKTVNTNELQTVKEQAVMQLLSFRRLLNDEITRSIAAYYDLLAAKEALTIQENAYQRAKKLKIRTLHLIKEGRLAKNEILEVESQVNQQALNISSAKLRVNEARFALLNQLNLPLDEKLDVQKTIHLTQHLPKPALATLLALQNDVSLQQEQVSLIQAKRQFEIAQNNNEWQLDLNLAHQLTGGESTVSPGDAISNVGTKAHDSSAMLSFSMPLGNDLTRKRLLVAARVHLLQTERKADALKRELESRIITELESLRILKESLRHQEATLVSRRKAAESASLKYNEGRISAFELTDIQDMLTAAEEAVINSKIQFAKALAAFDARLGTTMDTWRVQFEKQAARFEGRY